MPFIDSTTLKVCHYIREKQHEVFKGIADKSFGTLGWFYGFKLDLICVMIVFL
nr:transposase [Tenacibaculum sp. SZ-18]